MKTDFLKAVWIILVLIANLILVILLTIPLGKAADVPVVAIVDVQGGILNITFGSASGVYNITGQNLHTTLQQMVRVDADVQNVPLLVTNETELARILDQKIDEGNADEQAWITQTWMPQRTALDDLNVSLRSCQDREVKLNDIISTRQGEVMFYNDSVNERVGRCYEEVTQKNWQLLFALACILILIIFAVGGKPGQILKSFSIKPGAGRQA